MSPGREGGRLTNGFGDTGPSRGVFTVPNAVSFVRLLAIPWFWWLLVGEGRVVAAAWLAVAVGATDWVDGYLARRLDQISVVGKILDPVADRLMIASVVIGGLIAGVLPLVIGVPLLIREAAVAVGALALGIRRGGALEVKNLGKMATFLLYGAVPAFYLEAAGFLPWLFAPLAWLSGVVGLVLYYWVGVAYLGEMRRALHEATN